MVEYDKFDSQSEGIAITVKYFGNDMESSNIGDEIILSVLDGILEPYRGNEYMDITVFGRGPVTFGDSDEKHYDCYASGVNTIGTMELENIEKRVDKITGISLNQVRVSCYDEIPDGLDSFSDRTAPEGATEMVMDDKAPEGMDDFFRDVLGKDPDELEDGDGVDHIDEDFK